MGHESIDTHEAAESGLVREVLERLSQLMQPDISREEFFKLAEDWNQAQDIAETDLDTTTNLMTSSFENGREVKVEELAEGQIVFRVTESGSERE